MIFLSAGIFCTKKYEFNNPLGSDYQGSYVLHVQWKTLPSTLHLDTAYRVPCVVGAAPDTFASIGVDSADTQYVDNNSSKNIAHDMLVLYFKKAFNGKLYVVGTHPNGKETRDSAVITVVNQYKPRVEFADTSASVGNGVNPVMVTISGLCDSGKSVCDPVKGIYWKSGNLGAPDSLPGANYATINEKVGGVVGGKDTLILWAIGQKGYSSDTLLRVRAITGYVPVFHGIDLVDSMQCGDTLRFKVRFDSLYQTKVRAIVSRDSGTYKDTSEAFACSTSTVVIMTRPLIDTGKVIVSVRLRDASGALSAMIPKDTIYIRYKVPVLSIQPAIELPVNAAQRISVINLDSAAVKYVWTFGPDKPDTTSVPSFTKTYGDTGTDSVIVRGINVWGFAGKPVQAVITIKKLKYSLIANDTIFPTDVAARRLVRFGVILSMDSSLSFSANGGGYHWHVDSGTTTIFDTTGPDLSSITRKFPDGGVATITVVAFDTIQNKSNQIVQQVTVHRYEPKCAFNPRTTTTRINRSDTLKLHYYDTNPDGSGTVDSVYWDVNEDGVAEVVNYRDSTLPVSFTSAGAYTMRAWVKDNDGFPSSPDSIRITVTSDHPYRNGTIPDTVIYINTALFMKAQFLPGDNQSKITGYTWHISGAEHPKDTVTSTAGLARIFDTAGVDTVTVNCTDMDGLASVMLDTFLVKVSKGEPVALGITPHAAWTNAATQFTALSTSVRPGTRVVRCHVSWDNSSSFTRYDTTAFSYSFPGSGLQRIRLYVVDNDSIASDTISDSVMVRLGKPVAISVRPDSTVFIKDVRHYSINAFDSATGKIAAYYVSIDKGGFRQLSAATFDTAFGLPGVKKLQVVIRNDRNIYSDTLSDSVMVNVGKPAITAIAPDVSKDSVFVLDARAFTIKGHDSHGHIDSVKVSWNGTTQFTESVKAVGDSARFPHTFTITDTAVKSIRVRLVNDGAQTTDSVYSLKVRLGKPVVDAIAPQTVWVNDDTTFVVTARDTNGTVDSLIINWGDGTAQVKKAFASTITHKYAMAQYGSKTVKVVAKDNDGIYSDTAKLTVNVQLGKPWVTGVTTDTNVARIYIDDPITFTVAYADSNGSVDSISIDNGTGAFGPWRKVTGTAYSFVRKFSRTEAGSKTVRAKVMDFDGVVSDASSLTVNVQLGAPTVDSVSVDTTGKNIFVKDVRTYKVYVSDVNGTVTNIYAAWNNGANPDTSIAVVINKSGYGLIPHAYDTTFSGSRVARFWAQDEDTVRSINSKDTSITVRLGALVLFGDNPTKDTVWTVIDSGVERIYPVHINHYDTNGTILNYYWNGSGATLGRPTTTDTIMRNFSAGDLVVPFNMWISGKDDDSLVRAGSSWWSRIACRLRRW